MATRPRRDTFLRRRPASLLVPLPLKSGANALLRVFRSRGRVRPRGQTLPAKSAKIRSLGGKLLPRPLVAIFSRLRLPRIRLHRGLLWRAMLIMVLGLIVLVAWYVSGVRFSASSHAAKDAVLPTATGETLNILVGVYDSINDYDFLDFVGVVSVSKKNAQRPLTLVNISPNIATYAYLNRPIKLSSLLASTAADGVLGLSYAQSGVQAILGVRIDRYLLVNKQVLLRFLNDYGWEYTATSEVRDAEVGAIDKGQKLSSLQLMLYLAADAHGGVAQSNRLSEFLGYALPNTLGLRGYVRLLTMVDRFAPDLETNLTVAEAWQLALNLYNQTSLNYVYIGESEARLVESRQGGYLLPDITTIDQKLGPVLARDAVLREQARIEVFNGSGKSGLATLTRRLLTNQGAKVIRAGNAPEKYPQTTLYIRNPEQYAASIGLISEMLREKVVITEEAYPFNHTGDLVLVLGEDI